MLFYFRELVGHQVVSCSVADVPFEGFLQDGYHTHWSIALTGTSPPFRTGLTVDVNQIANSRPSPSNDLKSWV